MSGNFKPEGYVSLDCGHSADIIATVPPLPAAVKEQEWSEVIWIHGPGCLYPWQLVPFIAEIRSVLVEDGGKLVMETPDRRALIASQRAEWIYGDPSFKDPRHMVKWAYTPAELFRMTVDAGFSDVHVKPAETHVPQRDFRIEAFR